MDLQPHCSEKKSSFHYIVDECAAQFQPATNYTSVYLCGIIYFVIFKASTQKTLIQIWWQVYLKICTVKTVFSVQADSWCCTDICGLL